MMTSTISSAGGSAPNEDLIAVIEHDGLTDILVLDGASSVADANYIDPAGGDVAWFVAQFCAALEQAIGGQRAQRDSVAMALQRVQALFVDKAVGLDIPIYAYPIAALSWLRISTADGAPPTLQAYCVGDCKALVRAPDGSVIDIDPFVNPQEQILQAQMATLRAQGVTDAVARKAALMPMLRERRVAQNTSPAPIVLCPVPRGPLVAREYTMTLAPGATVLAMTDGFYRLVDTYKLHTAEELADLCVREGLAAVHERLRAFEAQLGAQDGLTVKRADDASAIMASFA